MSPDEIRDVVERRFLTALLETLVDWPQIDVPRFVEAVTRRAIEARKVEQPAPAAPVTDAEIETAVERCIDAGLQHGYLSNDLYDERERLLALIARRIQRANAAAEDLRKRYDHLDLMMMFQSQLVAGVLAGKRIEGSDLLAQRQGHFTEGDVQLLELVRRVAAAEELARAVEFALEPGPLDGKEVAMTAEIRIAARALRQEKAERLRTALAAFRKAQGGGK